MGCIIEFSKPFVRFEFTYKKHKQRIFIEMLLKYSQLNIASLATSLDVSVNTLKSVCSDSAFLDDKPAKKLAHLFILFVSE